MKQKTKKNIEKKVLHQLMKKGISLNKFVNPRIVFMFGKDYHLPVHNEKDWFLGYIEVYIEDNKMDPLKINELTRELYGLLRYKQALAGSSYGSSLGAKLALSGHIGDRFAKEVYSKSLLEYDSKVL
jgi:hypothetical protein|tara:strand:- start:3671 stop:4051 length:381 start_codon:yes stop_codon:yes gene_type:complete